MRKTGDFVKLKDKSMYFPKVELTYDELYTLYVYGHAKPYFLRQIVVNIDMLENIITKNSKNRPNEKDGYKYLLGKLQERQDEAMQDLIEFSQGNLDLIDLSVKYGFYYYDLKKAFDEVLDVDVNEYWKQHKKYVQKHTCLELYGVDSSAKVANIQAKQKATVKAKYGAENIMQTDTGKKRLQKTMMERYGVPCNLMARDDVYDFSKRCYDVLMGDNVWVRVLNKFIKAYFKSDANCDIIKSFSDNNIGDGVGYARAGAELVGEIKTSLCFISPNNGLDMYSWQIATPWSAKSGVLSKYTSQLSAQNEIDEYIETKMPYRFDDGHGYDRVYCVGSKIWQFSRQK